MGLLLDTSLEWLYHAKQLPHSKMSLEQFDQTFYSPHDTGGSQPPRPLGDPRLLTEQTQTEVWELAERAERTFMPQSPRPVVDKFTGTPCVAVGIAETPIYPVNSYIHTYGQDGQPISTEADLTDTLLKPLRFGMEAQPGDRTIITERRFPGRTIHYFTWRTEKGLVIQPYEKRTDIGHEGEDRASYPTVLLDDEMQEVARRLESQLASGEQRPIRRPVLGQSEELKEAIRQQYEEHDELMRTDPEYRKEYEDWEHIRDAAAEENIKRWNEEDPEDSSHAGNPVTQEMIDTLDDIRRKLMEGRGGIPFTDSTPGIRQSRRDRSEQIARAVSGEYDEVEEREHKLEPEQRVEPANRLYRNLVRALKADARFQEEVGNVDAFFDTDKEPTGEDDRPVEAIVDYGDYSLRVTHYGYRRGKSITVERESEIETVTATVSTWQDEQGEPNRGELTYNRLDYGRQAAPNDEVYFTESQEAVDSIGELNRDIATAKPLTGITASDLRERMEDFEEEVMGMEGVNGMGIQEYETGENRYYALTVYLENEPSEQQVAERPQELDGIPVRYEVIGTLFAE